MTDGRLILVGAPLGNTGDASARLATVRPDGSPHVVPIVFALVGDRLVTAVDAKPEHGSAAD